MRGAPATLAASLSLAAMISAAAEGFSVRPSEVAIPAGSTPADIRRVIQPFRNWTLICDENHKHRTKICNATQTIVDAAGETVFSWSLATAANGQPLFILRAPASVGPNGAIMVNYHKAKKAIVVPIRACDAKVCVATMRVGNNTLAQIKAGAVAAISFEGARPAAFNAPLGGLQQAVASIN